MIIIKSKLELQEKLEDQYLESQRKLLSLNKIYKRVSKIPVVNKYYLDKVKFEIINQGKIFKDLREITRENFPNRFIKSC